MPIATEQSFGKRGLVAVHPSVVSNGDRLPMTVRFTLRCRTPKLTVSRRGTLGAQTSPFNPNVTWLLDSTTGGGLHALNLESGEEVWQTPHPGCNDVPGCGPAQSAAVPAIPGIVFSGGIDRHLRAFSADDGRIVWDADTKGEYRTVNGVA